MLILVSELNACETHVIEEESVHLLSVCHIAPLAEGEPGSGLTPCCCVLLLEESQRGVRFSLNVVHHGADARAIALRSVDFP